MIDVSVNLFAMDKNCDLVCLVFTSVADHGSYFYFEGKIENWLEKDFLSHTFIEKLISRKKTNRTIDNRNHSKKCITQKGAMLLFVLISK